MAARRVERQDHGTTTPVVLTRRRPGAAGVLRPGDWTDRWMCVGFADQLRSPGDVLPATLGLHAIHVRRDEVGLNAAFNAKPFGGCMSIPLQCAGAKKIRCPHLACAFSEDPGVLGETTDPAGGLRRQFVGDHPDRLVSIPLAPIGPLLFVYVGFSSPEPPDWLSARVMDCLQGARTATGITEHVVAASWRAGPVHSAAALAARHGPTSIRNASAPPRRVASGEDGLDASDGLVAGNLVLGRLHDVTVAALYRPLGAQRSSVLSAVLLSDGQQERQADAEEWQAIVGSCEVV